MRVGRIELVPHRTGMSRPNADSLSLSGTVEPNAPTWKSVAVVREQIAGMDGQLVAVTWPEDGKLDGFWRVDGMSVNSRSLAGTQALMDWHMGLIRVARGVVDFESTLTGATLTNVHGLTGTTPWLATPADNLMSDPLPTREVFLVEDGLISRWSDAARHSVWSADPDTYYWGASTIRQNLAVVTGRFPTDPPGIFELSNGLCRVRWIVGEVDWDQIDGTWDDMGDMTWEDMGGVAGVQVSLWTVNGFVNRTWDLGIVPDRVAVVRNDPHVCTVRLIEERSPGRRTLDLTLRRGGNFVHAHMRGPTETRTVLRTTAEAGTVVTGGIRSTNALDGTYYVAATVTDHTADTTQGGFTTSARDRLTFMVGAMPDSDAAAAIDRWLSYRGEEVRPVLR